MKTKLLKLGLLFLSLFIFNGCCDDLKTKLSNTEDQLKIYKKELDLIRNGKLRSNTNDSNWLKNDSIDLGGSIIVDDQIRHQSVYGGMNYGTTYELFSKFELNSLDQMESIDLKLINFQGPLNLGFFENENFKTKTQFNTKTGELTIITFIQGLNDKDRINVKLDSTIHKSQIKYVNVFRYLMPFNLEDYGEIGTKLHHNVFDEEFFYRSGSSVKDVMPRNSKPGHFNHKKYADLISMDSFLEDFNKETDSLIIGIMKKSGNCYQSKNVAYFRN